MRRLPPQRGTMEFKQRGLAFAIFAASLAAGCGGGSGGGTPGGPPATAAPFVDARPLAAGDAFSYAGTTTNAQNYNGSNQPASSTTTSQVAQSVAVTGPTTFNGLTDAYDFTTTETDASPLQTLAITTHTYYGETGTGATTDLRTSGYTSTDTLGQRTTVDNGTGNELVDILPETSGSWSNDGSQTDVVAEADGTSETRTYTPGGTYEDTTVYPQGSQFTPQPAPLTATIVENSDGSGTYSLPLFGTQPNVTISFGTPNPAGQIPIVAADPAVLETANPTAFYSPKPALYSETDVTTLNQTIPATCKAAAAYGTVANSIVQSWKRIDTVLGTLESFTQTSYIVPKYGVACVAMTDTLDSYYDYSGQSNVGTIGVAFTGGPTPLEIDTVTTTLGLTAGTVQTLSLRPGDSGAAGASAGLRLANARSNFLASVDRERLARKKNALVRLRTWLGRARAQHSAASPRGTVL